MIDYHTKHFPRIPREDAVSPVEVIKTGASFILLIICISTMGWCCVPYDKPAPTPMLTKEQAVQMTTSELARRTVELNEEMKRRAQK